MDIRNLRIGNYVVMDGIVGEVITLDMKAEGSIEISTLDDERIVRKHTHCSIDPIPITRTFLIECCGFDELGRLKIDVNIYLYFLQENSGHIILQDKESQPVIHFWDVRSLHQLQNLYHILKGQELKIFIKKFRPQLNC